ncbi:hypothetical protein CDIK_2422 [Cucumispora dikerogammari]|nr:hypothetical protein CDIK_2422 [Cucumispora dikerogammari]
MIDRKQKRNARLNRVQNRNISQFRGRKPPIQADIAKSHIKQSVAENMQPKPLNIIENKYRLEDHLYISDTKSNINKSTKKERRLNSRKNKRTKITYSSKADSKKKNQKSNKELLLYGLHDKENPYHQIYQ